jgi:hypothetical protein
MKRISEFDWKINASKVPSGRRPNLLMKITGSEEVRRPDL